MGTREFLDFIENNKAFVLVQSDIEITGQQQEKTVGIVRMVAEQFLHGVAGLHEIYEEV